MKRRDLQWIVDKYMRSLEKYARRMPGSFAVEDIHDWRVEYKRLRAFLRLCGEEAGASNLVMPQQIKEVYKAAGRVRDSQLFLAKIILFSQVNYAMPQFTKCLGQELFRQKEELVKKIELVGWNRVRRLLRAQMPASLQDPAIRQFVNRKVASIHILMIAPDREEDLHSVRKNVKDLIHGARIFDNDWAIPFPFPAWHDEKPVNDMAEKLGDFNDECITLSFLHSTCRNDLPEAELLYIDSWKSMQEQLVENQQQKLLQEIRQMQLSTH